MKQKGFVNIILIVLIVALAGVVLYFTLTKKPPASVIDNNISTTDKTIPVNCDADNNARIKIIKTFSSGWSEFEKNIKQRPVLGATNWGAPNNYQFIGNDRMFIGFEDGHISMASVIQYKCEGSVAGEFSSFKIPYGYPFEADKWDILYKQYGDEKYGTHSYTQSIFKGGQMVQFDDWTEVPDNIFIWFPKGY